MIVLDTDVLSLFQAEDAKEPGAIRSRIEDYKEEVSVTIVTVEEQLRGWLALLAKPADLEKLGRRYEKLQRLLALFAQMRILPFDADSQFHLQRLQSAKFRIGVKDLRIAAITLSHSAKLATRNIKDFKKVPDLRIEDFDTP